MLLTTIHWETYFNICALTPQLPRHSGSSEIVWHWLAHPLVFAIYAFVSSTETDYILGSFSQCTQVSTIFTLEIHPDWIKPTSQVAAALPSTRLKTFCLEVADMYGVFRRGIWHGFVEAILLSPSLEFLEFDHAPWISGSEKFLSISLHHTGIRQFVYCSPFSDDSRFRPEYGRRRLEQLDVEVHNLGILLDAFRETFEVLELPAELARYLLLEPFPSLQELLFCRLAFPLVPSYV
ncbi:uncharacterized protein BT62DRAFT_919067 [Guyanagaster necrorhizus]|uniref:Uncharacterized protein n=1 Tax=Guyanagaster necrorhizus TaxID=856835 RepID=A0A9P7VWD0_9AGAR|nr:uncharacterized protein BT62DRAFT_919067 [Guyanagaster necrorhizus MCA 3950]KAG7447086.1 hypothetical protein BT62DRAFT_919067 [Guyanagaster necrorhizus MCA 3950]